MADELAVMRQMKDDALWERLRPLLLFVALIAHKNAIQLSAGKK